MTNISIKTPVLFLIFNRPDTTKKVFAEIRKAKLLSIVSRECGLEDDEVHHFKDCSVECISETLEKLSKQTHEWIAKEAIKAKDVVNKRYSENSFSESVKNAMRGLLTK